MQGDSTPFLPPDLGDHASLANAIDAPGDDIDASVDCAACDALCCRLTVVLMPGDDVPGHLTEFTDAGLHVMARDEEGWCVAVDGARLNCSIYATRPAVCRHFAMGGPYCRAVRAESSRPARPIPLALC